MAAGRAGEKFGKGIINSDVVDNEKVEDKENVGGIKH